MRERNLTEEELRRCNAELEQRLHERTAQLEAANQELEAFAYSVSHDLRAPLRHIAGFLKLLRAEAAEQLPPSSHHYLERIASSADRLEQLIEHLLNFSRVGRVELRLAAVPLRPLLEEVLRELEPQTGARHILWKHTSLPQHIQADPALLRQVLLSLLSNAVKFTRPRDPAEIEIGCCDTTPQETVLFVRDNGVGFDMRYAARLFGIFQRLHTGQDFEGMGIGLANVRRIIHRHGGRAWAESQPNCGATVFFSLPTP